MYIWADAMCKRYVQTLCANAMCIWADTMYFGEGGTLRVDISHSLSRSIIRSRSVCGVYFCSWAFLWRFDFALLLLRFAFAFCFCCLRLLFAFALELELAAMVSTN